MPKRRTPLPTERQIHAEIAQLISCLESIDEQYKWIYPAAFEPVRRPNQDLGKRVHTSDTRDEPYATAVAGQPKWIRDQASFATYMLKRAGDLITGADNVLRKTMPGDGERFHSNHPPLLEDGGELARIEAAQERRIERGESHGNG